MTNTERKNQNLLNGDEVDLLELLNVLWLGKIKIIFITAIFAIFSVYYALSIPNQYKASVVLAPTESSNSGALSSAIGQFGSLASLSGLNVGGGRVAEGEIALEIMQSWHFLENFILTNNLAIELTSSEGWDESLNQLRIDKSIYDLKTNQWLIDLPSSWSLFQSFSNLLEVSKNNSTGLVTVSIEYYSPHIAKKWLDMYIDEINSYMQERKVDEVTRNIEYLEIEIKKTANSEMREVFYSLVEEQTKNKMLASVNPEYAFKAVNPSMVPEEKSQPRRSIICIGITLLGVFISLLLVLVMHYIRTRRAY